MKLSLEALSKRFGTTVAVRELSLEVHPGEFLSLLGPSGCGKTTTLRMIAGFERPTSGRIVLGERDVTDLPAQRRGMGMVFQSYALFPHLDVFENVAFGLKAKGVRASEIRTKVPEALARVDLTGYEKRAVQALSGGQQQRVALARALAPEPPVLLLDEPLSNLDAALRERTREELRALLKRIGITAIFVTHDQEEAFALSDRIAVLRNGELQQLGTPEELYRTPSTPFVATFVGRANFIEGRVVTRDGEEGMVEVGGAEWRVRLHSHQEGRVRVMVRPEALRIVPSQSGNGAVGLAGQVVDRRFAGANTAYRVRMAGGNELLVTVPGHGRRLEEQEVLVTAEQDPPLHAFPLESS
ncbi:MAG: ATP-binding cassette domain-containing protein [Gemmatimonas sp.]|nr:ATP-binding cassette domain-containing protein [Gemmatimonas sp.]